MLKPGEQRTIHAAFSDYPGEEEDPIQWGDRVALRVPMGRRDVVVGFKVD